MDMPLGYFLNEATTYGANSEHKLWAEFIPARFASQSEAAGINSHINLLTLSCS